MITYSATVRGHFRPVIEELKKILTRKAEHAVIETGKHLLEQSRSLVPKDTTELAASGSVGRYGAGFDAKVLVYYGGIDHPVAMVVFDREGRPASRVPYLYAVKQHERDYNHPNGGQKDYLGQPSRNIADLRRVFRAAWAVG